MLLLERRQFLVHHCAPRTLQIHENEYSYGSFGRPVQLPIPQVFGPVLDSPRRRSRHAPLVIRELPADERPRNYQGSSYHCDIRRLSNEGASRH